ncbi:spermidine synthase [Agromyces hippuratus]|uniref:Spermidine synthase n=1 Tax=Agromyces hippuratus TaxID=286438 RepID=A0A852WTU3_9MICO|nr:fused MFS/spermidine synthase [Agromyces hippuratus]NYG20978.1 spermidine synthase [Agromyces hippuratus]
MARHIEFEADVFSKHGLTLLVDGTAQSHVDPLDPTHLFFEYTRRIGHVIDASGTTDAPPRVLHLGGGALTLARYVAATRPGASQLVVELDRELLDAVLERLPLPEGAHVDPVVGDAASVIVTLDGGFDLVIVDLYANLQAPAFVATVEFMGGCLRLLSPGGVLAVNVADAAGLGRLRDQARAIARAAPAAALLVAGDPTVLSGAEEGNAVLVAAPDGLPHGLRERLLAHGPHPAEVLDGDRLDFVLWGAC